jgi:preprotein translocase subunit SecD
MRRNFWIGLVFLLAIIGLAGYISWPTTINLWGRPLKLQQGLDLQGGVHLVYQLDLSKTPDSDKAKAIESTRQVIERRVNTTGVAEPLIQPGRVGLTNTVTVELPGIKDVDQAVGLIGKTAQLDFREQDASQKWIPTGLTGKQLSKATVTFEQTTNQPQISLQFNNDGKQLFADITERNVGKPVGIFLDEEAISAPTVNEKISAGEAVISGNFTIAEVRSITNLLNAGALDVPIKLIEQRTVGATLGEESVKHSLVAGVIGLALVIVFMLINYRIAGLVAVLALIGYALITVAFYKYIPVTLTLSGIAGFILSIGMAVDANILIYERLREEIGEGKSLPVAMQEAFRRAWPSVRDSNAATLITCAILYFTTTGSIKGFAVTLALGVLISLFSSITLSRSFLRLFAMNSWVKRGLAKL